MKPCILMLVLTSFFAALDAQELEITAEPHHQMVLANDQVRVFNVEVPPHSETLMYWHRHDYIYVVLGAAQIVNAVKGKDPATLALADGDVTFVPGTFAHIFRNLSSQPFRNVTIELLRDEKLRQSPAHWNPAYPEEDRGLAIFHGGTQEILFVKDGVRVSEVELQPGAVIPAHHHVGPHLLVAINDYQMRSDVEGKGKGSNLISMTPGETKWTPGGYSHTLTNTGHNAAKFISLEFR
jgi:oxalate decarboxylase/phosphoglucose isomerase-like protein (cupin superfamily)